VTRDSAREAAGSHHGSEGYLIMIMMPVSSDNELPAPALHPAVVESPGFLPPVPVDPGGH
jgi:hypothetical protein